MVSGTLALKNGYYYAVLSYQDAAGKRHQKWVSTGLPQKGNKRRAEQELIRIRSEFEIPPAAGELNSNMLFADYLDQWLEVVRARIKPATFGSYQGMVKSTIGPYFRKKELTLKELEARHIQQFYTEKLKTVTPNSVIHYHAVIYQALKYAMKTDMVPQNVAMKVDRPRKNSFQPTFLDAEQMQKLFEVRWAGCCSPHSIAAADRRSLPFETAGFRWYTFFAGAHLPYTVHCSAHILRCCDAISLARTASVRRPHSEFSQWPAYRGLAGRAQKSGV